MARLYRNKHWFVNQRGHCLWTYKEGVFITWKKEISNITNVLDEDMIPSIPRNENSLAKYLIGVDIALPFFTSCGCRRLFWYIQPLVDSHDKTIVFKTIKLASFKIIRQQDQPTFVPLNILDL